MTQSSVEFVHNDLICSLSHNSIHNEGLLHGEAKNINAIGWASLLKWQTGILIFGYLNYKFSPFCSRRRSFIIMFLRMFAMLKTTWEWPEDKNDWGEGARKNGGVQLNNYTWLMFSFQRERERESDRQTDRDRDRDRQTDRDRYRDKNRQTDR